MNILLCADFYLPGYKAGGPIQTLKNMVNELGKEFNFLIVTRDRDYTETSPYPNVRVDAWNTVGNAKVFYLSSGRFLFIRLLKLVNTTDFDVFYLNSVFSLHFSINLLFLRRLRLIPHTPVILAPRGMLSPGALQLKRFRKAAALALAKMLRLHRGIVWQASSQYEIMDIQRIFGEQTSIMLAPNLSSMEVPEITYSRKKSGRLRVIFLSRISRKKNLDNALLLLSKLTGDIFFDIYGPIDEYTYWQQCQAIMSRLPNNINVQYHHAVPHEQIFSILVNYDLFFLPTLGENFGHSILEAMLAGCPVLISDQTPWRNLSAKGVGWDLPLQPPKGFYDVLQYCVNMDSAEHQQWCERARTYARQFVHNATILEQNRTLFHQAQELCEIKK